MAYHFYRSPTLEQEPISPNFMKIPAWIIDDGNRRTVIISDRHLDKIRKFHAQDIAEGKLEIYETIATFQK